ncbi:staygreen family protein [Neobacillus drentensis]|uniref:staygreen family protein n=1 Tax=Neobacillus drentensis TaxID=220684 RepID=UPI0008251751|nr:staygreen family protein [Neobacillus drentensis]
MFNPSKLKVKFSPFTNELMPIGCRKYTLTHSDKTGELFLSIGSDYNMAAIDKYTRDEFLAEIISQNNKYILLGTVYVSGGEFDEQTAEKRFMIFQREAKLAITAVIYGDRQFFTHYAHLLDSSIIIKFKSTFP